MKVLHDLVVVEPDQPKEKTASGLYLAEQNKTYPPTGKVVEVADSVTDIKPGDRVIFRVYAAVELDDTTCAIPYSGIIKVL